MPHVISPLSLNESSQSGVDLTPQEAIRAAGVGVARIGTCGGSTAASVTATPRNSETCVRKRSILVLHAISAVFNLLPPDR